ENVVRVRKKTAPPRSIRARRTSISSRRGRPAEAGRAGPAPPPGAAARRPPGLGRFFTILKGLASCSRPPYDASSPATSAPPPRPARRGRLPPRRPAAAGRPRLETLEDRTSPAVVRWVAGSGNWATPANWSTGRVPGPTDEVVINVSGTITVTHSQANDSIHSLISENDLAFTGGSLTGSGDSTLDSTFTLSGGTLASRGSLTRNHVFTWTGGTLAGRGHTEVNAGMVVSGPGGKSLNNQTLDDAAPTTWSGTGGIGLSSAVWNNLANVTL